MLHFINGEYHLIINGVCVASTQYNRDVKKLSLKGDINDNLKFPMSVNWIESKDSFLILIQ